MLMMTITINIDTKPKNATTPKPTWRTVLVKLWSAVTISCWKITSSTPSCCCKTAAISSK